MLPPRRHILPFRSSRSAAILLDAVRRTRHQRRHRLRKLHAAAEDSSGSKASSAQTNGHQGGISQGDDNTRQQDLFEKLPDDILHRIHSLLPVRDAACAACMSRALLRSWRCYSKLILDDHALRLPSRALFYARTSLPSIARDVESLILDSCCENANTPMLQSKLPHLKNLEIGLSSLGCFGSSYDVFSLVSFLDASPALESFILRLNDDAMARCPVVGDDDECPRRKVDLWHNRLRQVTITGFCSAKSLVELTVHILESTHSLECLTLDTTYGGYDRRMMVYGIIGKCPNSRKIGQCWSMGKRAVEEAHRAVKTAGRCIAGRVPLAVQFEVLGPCSRCHTGNQ
ncbi:hypothetical protein ACQ4PT_017972 [Festuca glaucescens]